MRIDRRRESISLGAWATALLLVIGCATIRAGEPAVSMAENAVSFKRDIAPILLHQCQSCHGPQKSKGKYRVDTFSRLMKASAGKAAPILAGKAEQSEIYKRLTSSDEDDRMPQKSDPLPKAQIDLIRHWIEQGASFDGPGPGASLGSFAVLPGNPPAPARYGRPPAITALAFSPDGKSLAASGYNEVTIWDSQDGHLVDRIGDIPQRVLGLAYSPDGKILAVAGGTPGKRGELRLIHLAEHPPANQLLERISDVMTVVRFSPDGHRLAAGGADNAIRIYAIPAARRDLLIEQHADWIMDLAFSPDGARIVSASRDKSCRVFDARTGSMESAFLDSTEAVLCVAWDEQGNEIFSAGRDREIDAWNASDGKKIGSISTADCDILHLAIADGLLFSAASDGSLRWYSEKSRTQAGEFPQLADCAYSLALDANKKRIAVGSYDGSVQVWTLADKKQICTFVAAPDSATSPR